jgi:hypothetical protein
VSPASSSSSLHISVRICIEHRPKGHPWKFSLCSNPSLSVLHKNLR